MRMDDHNTNMHASTHYLGFTWLLLVGEERRRGRGAAFALLRPRNDHRWKRWMLERLTHQARGLTRERGTCVRRRTIELDACRRRSPMLDVGGDFGWPACLGRVN